MDARTLLRQSLVTAADRLGGRTVLARFFTWRAKRKTSCDVAILYDDVWIHRIGSDYIPVSERFASRCNWESAVELSLEQSRDYWFFRYQPKLGDVIIDVGAGDGSDTVLFSRAVGESGRVIAIEAHPTTFRLLRKRCEWNKLQNVTLCHRAISDRQGEVYIEDNPEHEFNSVSLSREHKHLKPILTTTLDSLCQEFQVDHIDFLKMNIEGAERLAIKGAEETISKTEHVCIACHDFLSHKGDGFVTKTSVVEFLKHHGFDIVVRQDDRRDYVRDHVHGIRTKPSIR